VLVNWKFCIYLLTILLDEMLISAGPLASGNLSAPHTAGSDADQCSSFASLFSPIAECEMSVSANPLALLLLSARQLAGSSAYQYWSSGLLLFLLVELLGVMSTSTVR
jgi:hypothetical protein